MTTTKATRERSVILTADEVRAALAGTLGEIRRPVKPQPESRFKSFGDLPTCTCHPFGFHDGIRYYLSPFGGPGTVLVGKETWWSDWREPGVAIYDATPEWGKYRDRDDPIRSSCPDGYKPTREECRAAMLLKFWSKRPATTMPRWAARLRFENAGVHVEQVDGVWSWVVDVKRIGGQP